MTLHEAIEKVLLQEKRAMTAREIAGKLNGNKWYVKGEKTLISASHIAARVNNYPKLFEKDNSSRPLLIKRNSRFN